MAIVLVVEDEVHVRLVLSEVLRTFNHDVRLAETAAAGVKAFKIERPDAVILDTMLPDASGTVVLDEMRKLRPDAPVVMMSGHADEKSRNRHAAMERSTISPSRLVSIAWWGC